MDISSCEDNLMGQLENLESYGQWKSSPVKSFDTSMPGYTPIHSQLHNSPHNLLISHT